jgi:hypothetical protein
LLFLRCLSEIGTAPATEEENVEQLLLLSCLQFGEAKTQVSPAIMSHPSLLLHLLTTGYKRLTEGGCRAFALRLFALGLLL